MSVGGIGVNESEVLCVGF